MYQDLYVAKWLLQNTENQSSAIRWEGNGHGGYSTKFNEGGLVVYVGLSVVPCRPVSRIVITFSSPGLGTISIEEPQINIFLLTKKYNEPDQEELAKTMVRLLKAVMKQVSNRKLRDIERVDERK